MNEDAIRTILICFAIVGSTVFLAAALRTFDRVQDIWEWMNKQKEKEYQPKTEKAAPEDAAPE